jgi:hypothetical protein
MLEVIEVRADASARLDRKGMGIVKRTKGRKRKGRGSQELLYK